jgi:hypothetical protein
MPYAEHMTCVVKPTGHQNGHNNHGPATNLRGRFQERAAEETPHFGQNNQAQPPDQPNAQPTESRPLITDN